MPGSTGDPLLDHDILRRMKFQDKAMMFLLIAAFVGTLLFTSSLAYQQAHNNVPVTYYADPRQHRLYVDGHDVVDFVDVFNQLPKETQLQVTGFMPHYSLPDSVVDSTVDWLGVPHRVAFSFALDLSPWVVRVPETGGVSRESSDTAVGISAGDLARLRGFLERDTNDLAIVCMKKEVDWPGWEELATNIKHQIRQSGFTGVIAVQRGEEEQVSVYKNRPWANFMHSRTFKVLCAFSIFGWFLYHPYMWLRCKVTTICCSYRVDCEIATFWTLIADKVGPDGFESESRGLGRRRLM